MAPLGSYCICEWVGRAARGVALGGGRLGGWVGDQLWKADRQLLALIVDVVCVAQS